MADIDLDALIRTPITSTISPTTISTILNCPPFVDIDGAFNARDIGNDLVRSGYIYRSGMLEYVTEQGKRDIVGLGVKKIFDIRSAVEFDAHPDPEIGGVELEPALTTIDPAVEGKRKYESLPDMYMKLLETHQAVWTNILIHVIERPEHPCLIHCTGGKDRTGTIVALIYGLAGVSAKDIADEYALTRIGVEPAKESLLAKLWGGKKPDLSNKSFQAICDMSPDVMLTFLEQVKEKYGGVQQYVREELGFSEQDITQIRRSLQRQQE